MSNVIHAEGVTVRYGKRVAVSDVTLSVPAGSVYALLGRNGAGKSSLVRCLLGHLLPDAGRVTLLGEDVWRHRTRLMQRVGVVAEDSDAPPEMRVSELARFSASVYKQWDRAAFDARLARFGIAQDTRFGELSKGQKKQVSLALALAASPEVLILDDPTLGLDVVARKSLFEEVIADLAERGLTVLLATHDLASVETIAERVGILHRGRLVLDESLEALKSRFRRIRFTSGPPAPARFQTTAVRQWGSGTEAVVSNYDETALAGAANVAEVTPMALEDIFIALTGEEK